jgi:hypothetical protein
MLWISTFVSSFVKPTNEGATYSCQVIYNSVVLSPNLACLPQVGA